MNKELKQKLRDALWDILDGNYMDFMGICGNIYSAGSFYNYRWVAVIDPLKDIFKKWPYFSGDLDSPISHKYMTPEDAFDFAPLWEGEYGESRIQLVIFLLEQLGEPE